MCGFQSAAVRGIQEQLQAAKLAHNKSQQHSVEARFHKIRVLQASQFAVSNASALMYFMNAILHTKVMPNHGKLLSKQKTTSAAVWLCPAPK